MVCAMVSERDYTKDNFGGRIKWKEVKERWKGKRY